VYIGAYLNFQTFNILLAGAVILSFYARALYHTSSFLFFFHRNYDKMLKKIPKGKYEDSDNKMLVGVDLF
jgi:hypothetical protein